MSVYALQKNFKRIESDFEPFCEITKKSKDEFNHSRFHIEVTKDVNRFTDYTYTTTSRLVKGLSKGGYGIHDVGDKTIITHLLSGLILFFIHSYTEKKKAARKILAKEIIDKIIDQEIELKIDYGHLGFPAINPPIAEQLTRIFSETLPN